MVAEKASEDPRRVTLRDDVAQRLEDVAKALGKTRDELVNDAVAAELDEHERFVAAVEEGRASIARGERIPWAEVKRELAELPTDVGRGPDPGIRIPSASAHRRRRRQPNACR